MKFAPVVVLLLLLSLSSYATVSTNPYPLQIVTLHKDTDVEAFLSEHQLTPKHRFRTVCGFTAPMSDATIQELKADARVMFVEADGPVQLCAQTNGFGLLRMGFDQFPMARINGITNELDVDVAIFDSGISPHEDLPPSFDWYCPFSFSPDDESDHGTGVAGIVAALDNDYGTVGVSQGVRVWNFKVVGPPPENSWANVISGMDYAFLLANQIEVANFSLVNADTNAPINAIHFFLKQMVEAGIVIVASAGNDVRDLAGLDGTYGTGDDVLPASHPYVMAVSATIPYHATFQIQDRLWQDSPTHGSNFSQVERTNGGNFGTNFVASPGGAIDVAAPGAPILGLRANGAYGHAIGTSFAAPHVSGLVALYIAAHGRATNAAGVFAIRQAIINAALPQSQWNSTNTFDPDTNPEPLAIASESLVPTPLITKTAGGPGNFLVQFSTVPGYDYTLQSASDLTPPIRWTNIATHVGSNFVATVSVIDTNAANQSFYRLARSPSP